jgi:hypothetical protein
MLHVIKNKKVMENTITVNGEIFELTDDIYPLSEGLYYKARWYKKKEKMENRMYTIVGTNKVLEEIDEVLKKFEKHIGLVSVSYKKF